MPSVRNTTPFVIAIEAKQSSDCDEELDCRVAALLAMTKSQGVLK